MYFLLSGEGPTDLGSGTSMSGINERDAFQTGPMTVIIDRIVELSLRYSILESGTVGWISKQELLQAGSEFKAVKKSLGVPGKKRGKETRYFFNNARALARHAKAKQELLNDDVVAILFRDADGTASAERGEWETKWQAMIDGFQEEDFQRGVPMIPKPKSEAWLLCAVKQSPYQNCHLLEDRAGNDDSPHSLKNELRSRIGFQATRQRLCQMLEDLPIDVNKIKMPKFQQFRERLESVIT